MNALKILLKNSLVLQNNPSSNYPNIKTLEDVLVMDMLNSQTNNNLIKPYKKMDNTSELDTSILLQLKEKNKYQLKKLKTFQLDVNAFSLKTYLINSLMNKSEKSSLHVESLRI
jgi:hypothetical protein